MTPSVSVATAAQFSTLLEASNLLGQRELAGFRAVMHEDAESAARFLVKKGWLTKWQAGQLLGGFPRLTIGHYRLVQEIGRGYWGRVYLAEHGRLRKRVAIKVLSPQRTEQDAGVARFLAEARLSATFEHPNLISIHDAGRDGERAYVVMEFVRGTDMRQYVQKHGPVAWPRVANWAKQVAEACDYLHGRGLIHGRIRPSNLLVDGADAVKVLDVAARSRLSQDSDESEANDCYLAPEQASHAAFDARADVYSLGRTLRFLLSGRPPLNEPAARTNGSAAASPESARRAETSPTMPAEFVTVLDRMTAVEPEARFASMREVAAALAPWRRGPSMAAAAKPLDSITSATPATEPPSAGKESAGRAMPHADAPRRLKSGGHARPVAVRITIGLALAAGVFAAIGVLWMCIRVAAGA